MIPHVTINVIRPERRRWRRRLLLVCAAVVILVYWVLYEHVHTQMTPHATVKSGLTDLHFFTPHQENQSAVETSQAKPAKLPKDTNTHAAKKKTSVAIGMGISLKGIHAKHPSVFTYLQALPFFSQLVPSFCRTASSGYKYYFYLAHDQNDSFFTNTGKVEVWNDTFSKAIQQNCQRLGDVGLNLVRCNHSGRPAWAQNDAMMAAHKDGRDFFYRVNDDSVMVTPGWTSMFIQALQKMNPPLVGVVGPKHSGGNTDILTYDFVHRTHINIFGYHYPRAFPWWYADDWITLVYLPGRSLKLQNVHLRHTMTVGTRYFNRPKSREFINGIINSTKEEKLRRYLNEIQLSKHGEKQKTVVSSLRPASGKPPQSSLAVSPPPSRSGKTTKTSLPLTPPPSRSGKTTKTTIPVSPLPSRSGKTTKTTIPVSPLPYRSGKTTKTTIPVSPLPYRSGKTHNSTLLASLLPLGSGKIPNATLLASPLPSGSWKSHNSTLSVSPLLAGSGKSSNSTLSVSPLLAGSGKTHNSTLSVSPLLTGSGKIHNSTLSVSPLLAGSGKIHNSTLAVSPLLAGSGKTHNSTLATSSLPSGIKKTPNSNLSVSFVQSGIGKSPNSTRGPPVSSLPGSVKAQNSTRPLSPLPSERRATHQSIIRIQPTTVGKTIISFEPSKARTNSDYIPSFQLSYTKNPS